MGQLVKPHQIAPLIAYLLSSDSGSSAPSSITTSRSSAPFPNRRNLAPSIAFNGDKPSAVGRFQRRLGDQQGIQPVDASRDATRLTAASRIRPPPR